MTEGKGLMQSGHFYVQHIASADADEIAAFRVDAEGGQGLDDYLKNYALDDEKAREMRTYLVRFDMTDEIVGYFSLKAGLVSLNEEEVEVIDTETGEKHIEREFDTAPGVELANFAVNSAFIQSYPYLKGLGRLIFTDFIMPKVYEVSDLVGTSVLYIFALPYDRLIQRYEEYGFHRLSKVDEDDLHKRLKPRYDESCKFMYLLLE